MQKLVVRNNTGLALTVKAGQHFRITATSTVDFVCFNANDIRERFDQARTKVNQGTVFVTKGNRLISKYSNVMFTIVEDTFVEGHHDLQKGMCSKTVYDLYRTGDHKLARDLQELGFSIEKLPNRGCWENLTEALKRDGISPEDIPSPFNVFQTMVIDANTGTMKHSPIRPRPGTYIELRAEMDCIVAVSACPWYGYGDDATMEILE